MSKSLVFDIRGNFCLLPMPFPPSQLLALQAIPKVYGAPVGPPTLKNEQIVKNDQNTLGYLKCK